ncbi:MAG: sigma-E factor negative regulatory protein [Gammaproteobacteria bacterium]|nr:sigma-E factor negative regulatory protein [Gammaproteobacteria bacterium]NNF59797.1 sigma-E factor negative regulatory protein [Gammaproteobacteria bacterium]NNM20991.1 sigma-E factor negative regulatory protein [Gammaproteobacteria bacterium]
MSDELNSQLSAFVDNELAPEESELLVRRLCRDETLRDTAAAYTLIGSAMRGGEAAAPADFAGRVMMAVAGQQVPAVKKPAAAGGSTRNWGLAVAASAVLAVVALMTLPNRDAEQVPAIATVTPPPADSVTSAPADARELVAAGDAMLTLMPATDNVTPASFNVPAVLPSARYSAENRARLNKYLLRHVSTTGASPQGVATFRNVGFVTQTEADR